MDVWKRSTWVQCVYVCVFVLCVCVYTCESNSMAARYIQVCLCVHVRRKRKKRKKKERKTTKISVPCVLVLGRLLQGVLVPDHLLWIWKGKDSSCYWNTSSRTSCSAEHLTQTSHMSLGNRSPLGWTLTRKSTTAPISNLLLTQNAFISMNRDSQVVKISM